jgi:hypothetical protein
MKLNQSVLSIHFGANKKESNYYCLLERPAHSERWFLKHLSEFNEDDHRESELLGKLADKGCLSALVSDIPLTRPLCQSCSLVCPGADRCAHPEFLAATQHIESVLEKEKKLELANPKAYERLRLAGDRALLGRGLKRRFKKGLRPYWNRPVDAWVWENYFEQMLEFFGSSYDSFAQTSPKKLFLYEYWKRHVPEDVPIYEGQMQLVLLELLRSEVIDEDDLELLSSRSLSMLKIAMFWSAGHGPLPPFYWR